MKYSSRGKNAAAIAKGLSQRRSDSPYRVFAASSARPPRDHSLCSAPQGRRRRLRPPLALRAGAAARARDAGAVGARRLRPQRLGLAHAPRPTPAGPTTQWELNGPFGINAPLAWSQASQLGGSGGRGVTIAVLDSGIAYANRGPYRRSPDLATARFVRGYDFVDDDPYPNDEYGHGTFVASTIAATANNAYGTVGVAYRARIMPLRVLDVEGRGYPSTISRAIRYAIRSGADVINLSLELYDGPLLAPTPRSVTASRERALRARRRAPRRRRRRSPPPATAPTPTCPPSATTRWRSTSAARPSTAAWATTPTTARAWTSSRPAAAPTPRSPTTPTASPRGPAGRDISGVSFRAAVAGALRDPAALPRHLDRRAAGRRRRRARARLGRARRRPDARRGRAPPRAHRARPRPARPRPLLRRRARRRRRGDAPRPPHTVRMISTEQGAWWETLLGTEPSRKRLAPVMPLLPTTMRSLPRSSATSRIASAGSP